MKPVGVKEGNECDFLLPPPYDSRVLSESKYGADLERQLSNATGDLRKSTLWELQWHLDETGVHQVHTIYA